MKFIHYTTLILLIIATNCRSNLCANDNKIKNGIIIDSMVVKKADRILIVFANGKEIKKYNIALGKNSVGHKHFEGDKKTPEGLYYIDTKSAYSKYHKNLNISYPNQEDIAYAKEQNKSAGGNIKIHGLPNNFNEKLYIRTDWTLGCIALTNTEIDELFEHVKINCKILILP